VSSVSAPADKRFRRAHVKPARLRSSWRHRSLRAIRSIAIATVLLYGAYRGAAAASQSPALKIDRIVVQGNERMSTGEVLAVLDGLRGQNLLRADLDMWRARLLSSAWVHDADFRRSLPSTVNVVVSERQPIAIGRIRGQLYLVDGRGVLIDEYGPQYAELDLPIVDGLPDPGETGTTDAARLDLAARLMAAVKAKPEISRRVSQIDVRDVHNATVILTGDSEVLQLGDQEFLRRIESYVELAPTLRAKVADIDVVDLRFDGRVYVTPNGPAARGRGTTSKAAR
jgi:cell division septal protein FtsQ